MGALVNVPTVRGAYDAIERMLAPRLEALVRTQQYAQVTALLAGARSSAGAQVGSVAACLLHAYNLPASTDISRLSRQLGELDREVRQFRLELAAHAENRGEEPPDADA
jgi:phage host-nuclease inhibitor protein Gam